MGKGNCEMVAASVTSMVMQQMQTRRSHLRALFAVAGGITATAAAGSLAACTPAFSQREPFTANPNALVTYPARSLAIALSDLPPGFRVAEELTPTFNPAHVSDDPWGRVSSYAITFVTGNRAVPTIAAGTVATPPSTAASTASTPATTGASTSGQGGAGSVNMVRAGIAGLTDTAGAAGVRDTSGTSSSSTPPASGGTRDVVSSVNAYSTMENARAAFASWQESMPQTYRRVEQPPAGLPPETRVYLRQTGNGCLIGFQLRNVIASVGVAGSSRLTEDPLPAATTLARAVAKRIEAVAGR